MEHVFYGVEKLRGVENWCTWKFAVRGLLRGVESAYEKCTRDVKKPTPLVTDTSEARVALYEAGLRAWDKTDRAATQMLVKTLEPQIMVLLISCESAHAM